MAKTKTETPFVTVPTVPTDFDGAIAILREACRAIEYWKEVKRYANFTNDRNDAHTMLKKWERCAAESETVVKSYQLKLF